MTISGMLSTNLAMREHLRRAARIFRPKPSPHLLARQKRLDPAAEAELVAFVRAHHRFPEEVAVGANWDTPTGQKDLHQLGTGRLAEFRETVVPWLDSVRALSGLRILDVGCGTGASTVALAEQGALVTGVELEESPLVVARRRCEFYGVEAQFLRANAVALNAVVDINSYDLVLFFAVLEHMTHEECLQSLSCVWKSMNPGALLGIVDTPNRLWCFDEHTGLLPFFRWLPDEIAIRYCAKSPRDVIAALSNDTSAAGILQLQRRGRSGISYHEIDLALGEVTGLSIVSSLAAWRRHRDFVQFVKWLLRDRAYQRFCRAVAGGLPAAWFEPFLDIVLRR
jgi:S-adenosylmethionine-dependent methyltransferase